MELEDLSSCPGHSGQGRCVLSGSGREMAAGGIKSPGELELMVALSSTTSTVREDPQTHKV